ncbi:MAG TPA: hypothetical protein ENK30_04250, partial [Anaerolineae bacterium]|nr:hypothetical protein [Anaerolineae bacterium]
MPSRIKILLPLLTILALALTLSACQQPVPAIDAGQNAAKAPTTAPAPEQPQPEATSQPEATQAPADDGFQPVEDVVGKVILPPEAPASFNPTDRPDASVGDADATLTMYEWCDYAYPGCLTFNNEVLPQLKKDYVDTGKLRIVHKEFPVAGGDPSVIASFAAQCAAQQGKYQDMADWLYNNVDAWSQQSDIQAMKDAVKPGGEAIGLEDLDAFNACIDNEKPLEDIKQDYYDGSDLKFRELPGFVI